MNIIIKLKKNKGVATLEILMALAIIVTAISSVAILSFGSQSTSVGVETNQEALYIAKEVLENARATGRANFNSLINVAPKNYDIYTKSLTVTPSSDGLSKTLTSLVSWAGKQVKLTTVVTDWGASNTCNPALLASDDWSNPVPYYFSSADLAPDNNSNGLAISDLKMYQQRLYVTASDSDNSNGTFYIFDLPVNPSLPPVYRASIDNDPNIPGPNAISVGALNGKTYAFLASPSSFARGQLQIIDVTNPDQLGSIYNYKISNVTNAGLGNVIFYSKGYVYLGLTSASTSKEFNIIDVRNYPASPPVWKGGYSVENHDINAIIVKGKYAYIAHPTSSTDVYKEQVTVLDISDPTNPSRVTNGFFKAPDFQGNGKSLSLIGSTLYLGRTITTTSNPEFYILDDSDPINLSTNNTNPPGRKINDSVNGLTVRGSSPLVLAFLLTKYQFQILNISNPAAITPYASFPWTSVTPGNSAGEGTAINCSGNYFYTAVKNQGSLGNDKDIITIITPTVANSYDLTNSGDVNVTQGSSGTTNVIATATSGFPSAIDFSVSGSLPEGVTVAFNPLSCTPDCSTNLTVNTTLSTLEGTYPIEVTGTDGVSTTFNLVVGEKPQPTLNAAIYDSSSDQAVTSVPRGTTVYSKVMLSGPVGEPTGNVIFSLFKNNTTCSGASTQETVLLISGAAQSANNQTDAGNNPKSISYRVIYGGDDNYRSDAVCLPLTVN